MNKELIIKCIKFYMDSIIGDGKHCPTIDEMRELVQLNDIIEGLKKKSESEG